MASGDKGLFPAKTIAGVSPHATMTAATAIAEAAADCVKTACRLMALKFMPVIVWHVIRMAQRNKRDALVGRKSL
jgi:predicted MarR family transcription regulator